MSRNKNKNKNQRKSPAKPQNSSQGQNIVELLQLLGQFKLSGNTAYTTDAFSNPAARMGAGTDNLLDSTDYPIERLSYNWNLLTGLYRSHWVVRRMVDVVSEDMIKN